MELYSISGENGCSHMSCRNRLGLWCSSISKKWFFSRTTFYFLLNISDTHVFCHEANMNRLLSFPKQAIIEKCNKVNEIQKDMRAWNGSVWAVSHISKLGKPSSVAQACDRWATSLHAVDDETSNPWYYLDEEKKARFARDKKDCHLRSPCRTVRGRSNARLNM